MNTPTAPQRSALLVPLFSLLLLAGCASSNVPLAPDGEKTPPPVVVAPPRVPTPADTGPVGQTDGDGRSLPNDPILRRIVYFDFDSTDIRSDSQRDLEALARHFRHAQSTGTIVLEGHADERGGREYNLALGQKRAEAVRRALTLLGVPPTRMEAISWGEEKPAQEGKSEQAFSLNRRVELPR